MTTTHMWCGHCGDAKREHNHTTCQRPLELEPPRYCTVCRRHMVVELTPHTWTATCPEHGTLSSTSPTPESSADPGTVPLTERQT